MKIDTDALKASVDIVSVIGSFVALKKIGSEYRGICPFHNDHSPSLYVVPAKQIWRCFSCHADEEHGNDVIGFVQGIQGTSFIEACEFLGAEKREWKPNITQVAALNVVRVTTAPPASALRPKMATRLLGEPEHVREFRSVEGALLGYECRYKRGADPDQPGVAPSRVWTWGAKPGEDPGWACAHFTQPRPLYGLQRLREKPNAPVALFEGPKKADAGDKLLPDYACLSWAGGAGAWHTYDLTPLAGKALLLWPDADRKIATGRRAERLELKEGALLPYEHQPGPRAMLGVAAVAADPKGTLKCRVRILDVHDVETDGYDIADMEAAGMDSAAVLAWAKPRARDYQPNPAPRDADCPVPAIPPAETAAPASAGPPPEPPPEGSKEPPRGRGRKHLSVVDGNTALAPQEDAERLPAAMSEDFIAEQFAALHAPRWRYVKTWGKWFEWRDDGWYRDDTGLIDRLAIEITRKSLYWPEGVRLGDGDKRRVNSKRTAGAVRDIAMSHRDIAATVDQWDTDPWLLGVPGGVVDLRTGEYTDALQEQYITKRTAVAPESGPAPLWQEFLHTIMDDNATLIAFLQRYAGYCLTGDTREQCLAFLYGTGQNGKGVFITTIARVMGDYAIGADADVFMESDQQRHTTEMARLHGARLVHVDETDSSKRWNEKRIKRITGGGMVEARFMRQDDFEFLPQFKLLIAGNHKPQLRGVGKAIQRRLHLVPFTVTIPDARKDEELPQKLEAEYPQILQWMIEGCLQWQQHKLQAPAEVVDATTHYLEAEDVVGEWLEERTEAKGQTARPIAYKNYRAWIEARGDRPWASRTWWAALEERGFTVRKSMGTVFVIGLSLRVTDEPQSRYPD